MSIVPKEVVQQWNDDWYAMQALRPPFRDYIANRAAERALEQAMQACESIVTECAEIEDRQGVGAAIGCKLRILNILAGGESDGQ
jgi:hypothetical protein